MFYQPYNIIFIMNLFWSDKKFLRMVIEFGYDPFYGHLIPKDYKPIYLN